MTRPRVTILHRLPGRIRMRVSPAPLDESRLVANVGGHEGIEEHADRGQVLFPGDTLARCFQARQRRFAAQARQSREDIPAPFKNYTKG